MLNSVDKSIFTSGGVFFFSESFTRNKYGSASRKLPALNSFFAKPADPMNERGLPKTNSSYTDRKWHRNHGCPSKPLCIKTPVKKTNSFRKLTEFAEERNVSLRDGTHSL